MKIISILCAILFSFSSLAKVDLKLSTEYRSAPVAGQAALELGYAAKLWGNGASLGYLRPFVKGAVSDGYHSLGGGLEFYPFRFFGLSAKYQSLENNKAYASFNCEIYRCIDSYKQFSLQSNLAFKLGAFFLTGSYEFTNLDPNINDKSFIIPLIGMNADAQGEGYYTLEGTFGIKLIKSLAIFITQTNYEISEKKSRQTLLGLRTFVTESSYAVLAIGRFNSNLAEEDVMGYLNFSWYPLRGFGR